MVSRLPLARDNEADAMSSNGFRPREVGWYTGEPRRRNCHVNVDNEHPCRVCGAPFEQITPRSIDRAAFLRSFDGPDCGVEGCEREVGHIGDHRRMPPDPPSPFADLEDENADLRMTLAAASAELGRLRHAIEDFILWWDMPPFALDDDDRLRAEVDALRAALAQEAKR